MDEKNNGIDSQGLKENLDVPGFLRTSMALYNPLRSEGTHN
jgi:hypothetical protein